METPIFKLPDEVFLSIVGYVNEQDTLEYYAVKRGMSTIPIINFSMTCRRFRQVSGHLLVPHVSVDFRPCSLDRLEEISRHPSIRTGVRDVDVELTSFSLDLVLDFKKFVKFYIGQLRKFTHSEFMGRSEFFNEPGFKFRTGPRLDECKRVTASWERIIGLEPSGWVPKSSKDENEVHRCLLLEAHAQYKGLYAKQELLLVSGEFSTRVAAALARMPRVKSLAITDKLTTTRRAAEPWDPPVRPGVDVRDAYYQAMREGMEGKRSWSIHSDSVHGLTLSQSSIYTIVVQLPIAVYRAGVSLDHLLFDLDGLQWDKDLRADSETLLALSSAVQSLKSIKYHGSTVLNIARPAPVDDLSTFLGHLIKNPNLETINLDICGISDGSYYDENSPGTRETWARLPVSCFPLWPNLLRKQLTRLYLSRADFRCEQLLLLLASLPSHMEDLHLEEVRLVDGDWEDILHVIRVKRFADKDCLRLEDLEGGEYENMEMYEQEEFFCWRDNEVGKTVLEMYCLRLKETNPLTAFRQGNWSLEDYLELDDSEEEDADKEIGGTDEEIEEA